MTRLIKYDSLVRLIRNSLAIWLSENITLNKSDIFSAELTDQPQTTHFSTHIISALCLSTESVELNLNVILFLIGWCSQRLLRTARRTVISASFNCLDNRNWLGLKKTWYGFEISYVLLPFHVRLQSLFSHVGQIYCLPAFLTNYYVLSMQGLNQFLYSSFSNQFVWKYVCFVDIFRH